MAEEKDIVLSITLTQFDGPLDVLIALIKKNEWPVYDLPVAEITNQFLQYMRTAKDLDMELGGEFIETASWLVLLKSKSLVPLDFAYGVSPQEELGRVLLDHTKLAATTEFLRGRFDGSPNPSSTGTRPGRPDPVLASAAPNGMTLADVLAEAEEALAAARAAASFRTSEEMAVSVADQVDWLRQRLADIPLFLAVDTDRWFQGQPSPGARISLLLALLELARKEYLLVHQHVPHGPILVKLLRPLPSLDELDLELTSA